MWRMEQNGWRMRNIEQSFRCRKSSGKSGKPDFSLLFWNETNVNLPEQAFGEIKNTGQK